MTVKKALLNHFSNDARELSKHDVENAWIVFSNNLKAELNVEKHSVYKASPVKKLFKKVPSFYWSFPALAGALAVAIVVFNQQEMLENPASLVASTTPSLTQVDNENLAKHLLNAREYELPRPERFSELVSFVKSDVPHQNSRQQNEALNQRLFSELEGSLRDQPYVRSDSPQLIYVANE